MAAVEEVAILLIFLVMVIKKHPECVAAWGSYRKLMKFIFVISAIARERAVISQLIAEGVGGVADYRRLDLHFLPCLSKICRFEKLH